MVKNMTSLGLTLALISVLTILSSTKSVDSQTYCPDVIKKFLSCESYMFGLTPTPNKECCANAQALDQAESASKDVLRANCRCLRRIVQSFRPPVDLSKVAGITSICHLKVNLPVDPSLNCDTL
ncbi:hypothetical protein Lser_V15G04633 [Lactuca serriola]